MAKSEVEHKPDAVDLATVSMLDALSTGIYYESPTQLYEHISMYIEVLFDNPYTKVTDPYNLILNYMSYIPQLEVLNNTRWHNNFKKVIDNFENNKNTMIEELDLERIYIHE